MPFARWFIGLALLGAIILGYIHVLQSDKPTSTPHTEKQPQFTADNWKTTVFDQSGLLNYSASMKHIAQFEDPEYTRFENPQLILFESGQPAWQLHAQQGRMYQDKTAILEDNVVVRNLSENTPIDSISTQQIDINLQTKKIESIAPVLLTGEQLSVQGQGLSADLLKKQISIKQQVKTRYETK